MRKSFCFANAPSNSERLSHTGKLSVADSCLHKSLILVLGTEKICLNSLLGSYFSPYDDDCAHLIAAKLLTKLSSKAGLPKGIRLEGLFKRWHLHRI